MTFTEYGGPEVLHVADVEEPHAGPGQVRIAVRAAGVNPVDWKARSGMLREVMPVSFPAIDGREASGVIDEVGADVERVAPIADFGAAALGVKVSGGSEGRALEALDEAAALHEAGRLQLPVQQTFTFAQAPDAHRLSQDRHVRGKLVPDPGLVAPPGQGAAAAAAAAACGPAAGGSARTPAPSV